MGYFALLLAVLHVWEALGQDPLWDTTVTLAETMTLECAYPPSGNLTQIEWFKLRSPKKESIAIFNPNFGVIIRKPYVHRVYFPNSTSALHSASLAFRNASETDLGFFSCLVDIFPYGSWEKVTQVVSSDSFETAVPPSSHVLSKPGEDVTLSCELQMEGPMSQVTWEKIQPHQIDLLTSCNLSQGKSQATKYQRQILSNCSLGMRKSAIVLPRVTASDSGLYRCCFTAYTGENETLVVRLTVADGQADNHSNWHNRYLFFMVGGIVVLLLLVILITTAVAVHLSRRKRRQKTFQRKACEDTQTKASNNYRSPSNMSQPSDDTGEGIYVNYPTFSHRPKAGV